MATNVPNPTVCQSQGGSSGDGGAASLSSVLNTVGKWGTAITGVVAGAKVQGGAIQAKAQTQAVKTGSNTLIVLAIIAAILIFVLVKK